MKKILAFVLALTLVLSFSACGNPKREETVEKYGSYKLKLFLPGEYISDDVISAFEKEYGAKLIVELFDSNEMMYTKLQSGDKYDVLIPSDYMVERLIANDYLQTLELDRVPNLSGVSELVPYGIDKSYGVPYFWGSVGIVYNHNNVPAEVVEAQGFEVLRNTDYKGNLYIYDSERDSFMMAFKALGYSMNTDNEQHITEAYEWLCEMADTMDPSFVTDEVIDAMATGLKDLAVVYSGDAAYILSENEDMSFFMPNEGTNIWTDYMVIPKNAENPLLAHEFINFMISYDAAYENSDYVGYASPVAKVLEDLTAEGATYYGNEAYLPRMSGENDEIFHDNRTLQTKLADLWIKVMAQ